MDIPFVLVSAWHCFSLLGSAYIHFPSSIFWRMLSAIHASARGQMLFGHHWVEHFFLLGKYPIPTLSVEEAKRSLNLGLHLHHLCRDALYAVAFVTSLNQ